MRQSGRRQESEVFLSFTEFTRSCESIVVFCKFTHSSVVEERVKVRLLVSVKDSPWLR